MKRRNLLGFIVAALSAPPKLFAQQPGRTYRLAVFLFRKNPAAHAHMDALRERLKQLGFVEGRNLQIVQEYSSSDAAAQRENAQKLVRARPDAILSFGSTNTRIVHAAAGDVPVIFTIVGDAVAFGLVKELARPGANLTGVTSLQREMTAKRLELLRELLPKAKRIVLAGYLQDVTFLAAETQYRDIAARLGLDLVTADGSGGLLVPAVSAAIRAGADALFVYQPISFIEQQGAVEEIVRLATERRIPVLVAESELVALGGLLSYGPIFLDETRRAAELVARVLKGAKASELPVEQSSRFEVAVNLKTAKALGITVPRSILLRADRVIE